MTCSPSSRTAALWRSIRSVRTSPTPRWFVQKWPILRAGRPRSACRLAPSCGWLLCYTPLPSRYMYVALDVEVVVVNDGQLNGRRLRKRWSAHSNSNCSQSSDRSRNRSWRGRYRKPKRRLCSDLIDVTKLSLGIEVHSAINYLDVMEFQVFNTRANYLYTC